MGNNPDLEWEKWGQKDPYFAVITLEKFRNSKINDDTKAEFFEIGRNHVRHVLDVCRQKIDPLFSPKRIVDFGCGTGRLVVPFAENAEEVTGIDISDSMLNETRANCDKYGLSNVKLIKSDDNLSLLKGTYDLVHSFTVFQHIPIDRGFKIFKQLLSYLKSGGIGVVHFTFSKTKHLEQDGTSSAERNIKTSLSSAPKSLNFLLILNKSYFIYLKIKYLLGLKLSTLQNQALTEYNKSKSTDSIETKLSEVDQALENNDPEMQMNSYDLNKLLLVVLSAGASSTYLEFSNHDGDLGVLLYFQKTNHPSTL